MNTSSASSAKTRSAAKTRRSLPKRRRPPGGVRHGAKRTKPVLPPLPANAADAESCVVAVLLARRRWVKRIPQQRLAKSTGVSQTMISYTENLQCQPTLPVLLRLSRGLGREFWKLLRAARRVRQSRRRRSRQLSI